VLYHKDSSVGYSYRGRCDGKGFGRPSEISTSNTPSDKTESMDRRPSFKSGKTLCRRRSQWRMAASFFVNTRIIATCSGSSDGCPALYHHPPSSRPPKRRSTKKMATVHASFFFPVIFSLLCFWRFCGVGES